MFATPIKKRRIGFLPPDLKDRGYYVRPATTGFSGLEDVWNSIKGSGYGGIFLVGGLIVLAWYKGWFDKEII